MAATRKKNRSARGHKAALTKRPRSYTPLSDALSQPHTFADTEMAEGLGRHGLVGLFAQSMRRKRRCDGEPLANVLCALLVWPLLKVKSIHCFCAELGQILLGQASVLYDLLGREDVNWRGLCSRLACRVHQANEMGPRKLRAFVVDDTGKARSGKKVEGTSCYFDHSQGKAIKGHQVLQLGLAGEKGFLPVESQIVMGQKSAIDKLSNKPFRDQRCSAARDLSRARERGKQQLCAEMLQRAIRAGFKATYLLLDAWFGSKENIQLCLENNLTALFQMRRGNLRYRYRGQDYNAHELYVRVQRRMRPPKRKARYKTAVLEVQINLETNKHQPPRWQKVQLMFSALVGHGHCKEWVLFLCTDLRMKEEQMLKVYSLRWSIEVYFKEIKQSLGFLKEQSGRYQVAYASIHLAAIRYLLLFEATLRNGTLSYGEIRDAQTGSLQVLTFAGLLWTLFQSLIDGALEKLVRDLGRRTINKVIQAINESVEDFLNEALQMKPEQVAAQLKAEELGYI